MTNKYTGEASITIGKDTHSVSFNWRKLAKIKSLFTDQIWSNLQGADPETLAEILVIGIDKHDVTKDYILDNSPPLIPVIKALDEAVGYAYFGPDGLPEEAQGDTDNKKKI